MGRESRRWRKEEAKESSVILRGRPWYSLFVDRQEPEIGFVVVIQGET